MGYLCARARAGVRRQSGTAARHEGGVDGAGGFLILCTHHSWGADEGSEAIRGCDARAGSGLRRIVHPGGRACTSKTAEVTAEATKGTRGGRRTATE